MKRFTFSLLRCKYLFDQHVIKREFMRARMVGASNASSGMMAASAAALVEGVM